MPEELRQMGAVDAIVQTVVSSPDDIVYISGSLIEGFGNQASDIDVFLITAGEPQYHGPFGSVLGDYYLDLEVYAREGMQALASRLNALDISDYRAVWLTPLADLDLYYRTLIGQACHNPGAFAAMRSDFSREVIERLLATWCGLRYAISLQQAREELDTRRLVEAALAGQAAAASALDAYLAAHGEAFPSLKWRFEKLARLHGASSDLYARAWPLKGAGSRDAGTYLDDVAEFAAGLGLGAYEAWTLDDVPLQKIGESRSHEIAGDAYIVQNQRFVYSVAPELREVFDRLEDGSTRATLRRELGDDEQAREGIASLQSRALLRSY
jgi:hypothetical protein